MHYVSCLAVVTSDNTLVDNTRYTIEYTQFNTRNEMKDHFWIPITNVLASPKLFKNMTFISKLKYRTISYYPNKWAKFNLNYIFEPFM